MRNNRGGRPRGRPHKEWSEYVPKGIDPSRTEEFSEKKQPSDDRHGPTEDKSGQSRINKNPHSKASGAGKNTAPSDNRYKDGDYDLYSEDEYFEKRGPAKPLNKQREKEKNGSGLMSYQKKENRRQDRVTNDPVQIDSQPREDREKNAYQWRECVVCLLKCSPTSTVWNCSECRITCHLKCIKDWICKQNNLEKYDAKQVDKSRIFSWACPHCQTNFKEPIPPYLCFCAKTKNPRPDVFLEPHSCGMKCGRKRGGQCSHPCPQTCHSGACPSCDVLIPHVACFCGRETTDRLCGDLNKRSCGQPCSKTLNCGLHKCEKPCHEGECPVCPLQVSTECHCSKSTQTRRCGETFSCGAICALQLNCEVHRCSQICHEGPCKECQLFPSLNEKCFCGKKLEANILGHPRDGCHEERKPCGQTCSRPLPCGHLCILPCHSGDCKCGKQVEKKCRCGQGVFTMECQRFQDEVLCDRLCKKKKTCGVHRCEIKCCIAFNNSLEHQCMDFCGKLLDCGIHPCPRKCHTGKCGQCTIKVNQTLRCACGAHVIPAPVVCGTSPPLCDRKCGKNTTVRSRMSVSLSFWRMQALSGNCGKAL